jgi:hypothetical protein
MAKQPEPLREFPVAPCRRNRYTPPLGQSSVMACGPFGARR